MTKYIFPIGNASVQIDNVNHEIYQVPMKTYIKSLNKWKDKPVIKGHEGGKITNIQKAFVNTDKYINYNNEEKDPTYLPSIEFEINDELTEEEKKNITGISNTIRITKSHIEDRQAGFNNVRIADEIEPVNMAILINKLPNFRECDLKMNEDQKSILTLEKKENNNDNDKHMAEEIKEQKCNEDTLKSLEAKLDKILSLLETKNNEDEKQEDKKEEDKKENEEDKKEEKEEKKEEDKKEEDKKENEEDKKEDKKDIKENCDYNVKTIYFNNL